MNNSAELPPLSLESLQPVISTKWLGRPVLVYDQIESTNTYATQLVEKGTSHGTVVLADSQTGGKGRLGREWHSPANMNIYLTVILTQHLTQPFISWIPLATGIAMADTIEEIAKLNVSLKWPNDLLFNTKKLGGILCERTPKRHKGPVVIVGIGLNVNGRKIHFPPDLQQIATSLAIETGQLFDRHVLLSTLFSNLEKYYERVFDSDLTIIHANYVAKCSTLGRHVQARLPNNKHIEGIAVNIGNEGELQMIPSNPSVDSINKIPETISIRAGDIIHLR